MIILNLLLDAVVIWAGTQLSPETIIVRDNEALIITVLIMWVVSFALGIIEALLMVISSFFTSLIMDNAPALVSVISGVFWIIAMFALGFVINYLTVYLVSSNYDGFTVTNTTHMFLLSLGLALTNVVNSNKK